MSKRAVVAGAGGFIGHHLVRYLKDEGYWVRGVDLKEPEFETSAADEFQLLDLRGSDACEAATSGVDEVYQLAADMGGIGYITEFHADVARNNVLINAHMLEGARRNGVERYFYSSSACIYPMYRQEEADVTALKEEDAYPAEPEEGYGWEKLYAEKLCQYYTAEGKVDTRVARFHNIYGPLGTYEGGREKAPAAICRKVAMSRDGDEIEIWGDGSQTRSFTYIDDCVEGIHRIMRSGHASPLNLGSDELVSVDRLVDLVCEAAGKSLRKRHDTTKPQGVRGRNSDNSMAMGILGWAPATPLRVGIASTYRWIASEVERAGSVPAGAASG
ncbi:MAG TPA: NAD-dependent epimerase/dehydratase family protein [Actinomycetota bacterium]|nr:NAD-dependent epimerase/dehydratase family protein [Actinomycetota bacterium]